MVHYIHLERLKESVSSGDEDITGEPRELAERYFYERLVKLTRAEVAGSRGPREGEKPAFHRSSVARPPFLYCPHRQRVLRVPLPACFERTLPRWSLPPLLHFESPIFVDRFDTSP